jgi:hypothetical protein
MKRIDVLVVVCVLAVLPFLMGASCTLNNAVPNPIVNGVALGATLDMDGAYSVDGNQIFVGVTAYASKLPTPPVQLLAIDASNAGGGLWDVRITGIVDRWKVYGKTRYVDPVAPLVTLF